MKIYSLGANYVIEITKKHIWLLDNNKNMTTGHNLENVFSSPRFPEILIFFAADPLTDHSLAFTMKVFRLDSASY
jgi:hypothetical protein